ncbi:MAG: hypothetical protein M3340_02195 [Actinomycetota bacterium]|nr:hypothetical protein [Actinomycetota bacterium]
MASSATLIAENDQPTTGDASSRSDQWTRRYLLKNVTGTASVYLGGTDAVTTGNGFEWTVADGPLEVELEPGEKLYGVVAATTQAVHVLRQGR